jgi:4'-phosphopantetheinyl transferase
MSLTVAASVVAGTVRVGASRLSEVDLPPRLLRLLEPIEVQRADRYLRQQDQHAFLAGRVFLRQFTAEMLGVSPSSLALDFVCLGCGGRGAVDHGSPGFRLTDGRRFSTVSSSRSGPWGLLAGSIGPGIAALGIDLEDSRRMGFDGFDGTALGSEERGTVEHLPNEAQRNMLRARLWARKEAVLKSAGTGLAQDPAGVDVLSAHRGATELVDLDVTELGLPAQFTASLAVARHDVQPKPLQAPPPRRAAFDLSGATAVR